VNAGRFLLSSTRRPPRSKIFSWRHCRLPLLAIVVSFALAALAENQAPAQNAASAQAGSSSPQAGYAGADTCKTCHEDIYNKGFANTPHFKTMLDTRRGPSWHGCEACHGPGSAHVEGGGDPTKIFNFKKATVQQVNQRCLGCHQTSEQHANFTRGPHATNGVSCINCHSPHHAVDHELLLAKRQPLLCYSCHADKRADFDKPFHHRVNEGLIKCNDCHNVHGSYIRANLRTDPNQQAVCYKCHTDKQGPFVFEHVPVKTEGCTSCHNPHGSTNPRMLNVGLVNMLCLQCHSPTFNNPVPGTPTFHNQATRYQACTLCHVAIHGSNFDQFFFK
jgi:DmsE family decaheme c-type cytochrome